MDLEIVREHNIKGREMWIYYKPTFNDKYYFINKYGEVDSKVYRKDDMDKQIYQEGRSFPLRDIAELEYTNDRLELLIERGVIGKVQAEITIKSNEDIINSLWDVWLAYRIKRQDVYNLLVGKVAEKKCITCSYIRDKEDLCDECDNYALWTINEVQSGMIWEMVNKIMLITESKVD